MPWPRGSPKTSKPEVWSATARGREISSRSRTKRNWLSRGSSRSNASAYRLTATTHGATTSSVSCGRGSRSGSRSAVACRSPSWPSHRRRCTVGSRPGTLESSSTIPPVLRKSSPQASRTVAVRCSASTRKAGRRHTAEGDSLRGPGRSWWQSLPNREGPTSDPSPRSIGRSIWNGRVPQRRCVISGNESGDLMNIDRRSAGHRDEGTAMSLLCLGIPSCLSGSRSNIHDSRSVPGPG